MWHTSVYVGEFFVSSTDSHVAPTTIGIHEAESGLDSDDEEAEMTEKRLLFEELELIHAMELQSLDVDDEDISDEY